MKFTIDLDCDNSAFEDNNHEEIARILIEAARRLQSGEKRGTLRDVNGNRCGSYAVKP